MKLSVIVCTYNRSERLKTALESLREAVIPDDLPWECILVDNNSDDSTRFVFEEVEKHYESKIRYVFEEKRGLSHARNRGIKEARGEIIAFTDDDVIVDKYWIQNIGKAFKEHGNAACVGGKILPIWEIPKPKWLKPNLYIFLALLDYGDSVAYMDTPYIWGANFAVKSEMFKKYGLFNSNLGRIPGKLYSCDETEFLQRLLNANENILYYPLAIVHHCISADRISKRYFRKWRFDSGELNGILKNDMKHINSLNFQSPKSRKDLREIISRIFRSKNWFDNELRICYILGFLSGRMKRMGLKS